MNMITIRDKSFIVENIQNFYAAPSIMLKDIVIKFGVAIKTNYDMFVFATQDLEEAENLCKSIRRSIQELCEKSIEIK